MKLPKVFRWLGFLNWTKEDIKFTILVVIAIILFRIICVNPLIDKLDDLPTLNVNGSVDSNISGSISTDVSGSVDADVSGHIYTDTEVRGKIGTH